MSPTGPALAILISLAGVLASESPALSQSLPASRPSARPPTDLVGLAEWEKGDVLLKRVPIPAAPVRSPEEELGTFRVDPDYRVELVASEPMIRNPIAFEFDPEGRIWVVEYAGYMRDLAASGEDDPICRVVVLEDTDGDGRADRSTVFLDHLSLPRSLAFVNGGVLIQEPPHLWFCEDTDGDLRCNRKRNVGTLGSAGDPQNTANGLRPGLDNWLHIANGTRMFQWRNGELNGRDTIPRGQFGVDFDETGRFLTTSGHQPLCGDLIPAEYLVRNPRLQGFALAGENWGIHQNLAVGAEEIFPIRPTPGVTLGARELREDGRLRTYTAASGICFYDGTQFPPDARRNVFVPEPAGNLVGRLMLSDAVAPSAKRFYPEEREFLASTDERFRPVSARVGPDGALYLADLYHGILEHSNFMVPWLSRQISNRKLDQGNDLGRLWRVVAKERPIDHSPPRLGRASSADLVANLSHTNGWHRRTAQRLLVERADTNSIPLLRATVRDGDAIGALHALWTLEGMAALDPASLQAGLESPDDRVRSAAVRLCEREDSGGSLTLVSKFATDPSPRVRLQVALTAGTFRDPAVLPVLMKVLSQNDGPEFRAAVLSGLEGLELEFLSAWMLRPESRAGDPEIITQLTRCILDEGQPGQIADLFRILMTTSDEHPVPRQALLEALAGFAPPVPFALEDEPRALTTLLDHPDPETRTAATRAAIHFTWPGATPASNLTPEAPLNSDQERTRARLGEGIYRELCVSCHQPHGLGIPGKAPPLAASEWVVGPPERTIRILLQGVYGPLQVCGQTWNLHMPAPRPHARLDDEKAAQVLTYIRNAWGNQSPAVDPTRVADIRRQTANRVLPWRAEELTGTVPAAPADAAVLRPDSDGVLTLPARLATLLGPRPVYSPSLDRLGQWRRPEDAAEWIVEVPADATYTVHVLLAAGAASEGNRFVLQSMAGSATGIVRASGSFDQFRDVDAGPLTLSTGIHRLLLRPEGTPIHGLGEVQGLKLVPLPR